MEADTDGLGVQVRLLTFRYLKKFVMDGIDTQEREKHEPGAEVRDEQGKET